MNIATLPFDDQDRMTARYRISDHVPSRAIAERALDGVWVSLIVAVVLFIASAVIYRPVDVDSNDGLKQHADQIRRFYQA